MASVRIGCERIGYLLAPYWKKSNCSSLKIFWIKLTVSIYGGKVTSNSIERLRPVTYNTTLSISFPQNVRLRPYPRSQAAGLKCGSLVRSQGTGHRSGRRPQVTGHRSGHRSHKNNRTLDETVLERYVQKCTHWRKWQKWPVSPFSPLHAFLDISGSGLTFYYCWFSVSRHSKYFKIKIKTVQ